MKQLSFQSAGTKISMIACMNRLGRVYQAEIINKESMYFVFATAVLKLICWMMRMAIAWRLRGRAVRQPANCELKGRHNFNEAHC